MTLADEQALAVAPSPTLAPLRENREAAAGRQRVDRAAARRPAAAGSQPQLGPARQLGPGPDPQVPVQPPGSLVADLRPETTGFGGVQTFFNALQAVLLGYKGLIATPGKQLAANAGANPKERMGRMGHHSKRAALIYLHSTSARQRVLADASGNAARTELAKAEKQPKGTRP